MYSDGLDDAFQFAHSLHRNQARKGPGSVPYINHLMSVAALVGESGGDEEQVIAALLHDAIEDQGGKATGEQIRARFGPRVQGLVEACSDAFGDPKPPWKERKMRFMASLSRAPREALLIVAADKLHNARTLLRGLKTDGLDVFKLFRCRMTDTLWYYRGVLAFLSDAWPAPITCELEQTVVEIERLVGELSRGT